MFVRQTIEIRPNNKQKTYFRQCFGARRLAYNYGLAEWIRLRDSGEKTNVRAIRAQFNAMKAERYPFLSKVSCAAITYAFDDLKRAFENFFRDHERISKGNNARLSGFPQPKSKSYSKGSYTEYFSNNAHGGAKIIDHRVKVKATPCSNGNTKVVFKPIPKAENANTDKPYLLLPRIGTVRMTRQLRYNGRPVSVTIRQHNERFYACFLVEITEQEFYRLHPRYTPGHAIGSVGIDLGTKELAVTSDGLSICNPRYWEKSLTRIQCLEYRMNHCTGKRAGAKPSKNFLKLKHRIWRLNTHISNQRSDYRDKLCAALLAIYQHIAIETLEVKSMGSSMLTRQGKHTMRKRVRDASLYQIRHRLETLGELLGRDVVAAPQGFPSTRRCSKCGHIVPPMRIDQRIYRCPKCDNTIDRDLNAALNLRNLIGGGTTDSMPQAADRLRSELIKSNISHSQIGEGKKAGTRS